MVLNRKSQAQYLTAAKKFAHLFRTKQPLRKYLALLAEHTILLIWFSYDKFLLFLLQ